MTVATQHSAGTCGSTMSKLARVAAVAAVAVADVPSAANGQLQRPSSPCLSPSTKSSSSSCSSSPSSTTNSIQHTSRQQTESTNNFEQESCKSQDALRDKMVDVGVATSSVQLTAMTIATKTTKRRAQLPSNSFESAFSSSFQSSAPSLSSSTTLSTEDNVSSRESNSQHADSSSQQHAIDETDQVLSSLPSSPASSSSSASSKPNANCFMSDKLTRENCAKNNNSLNDIRRAFGETGNSSTSAQLNRQQFLTNQSQQLTYVTSLVPATATTVLAHTQPVPIDQLQPFQGSTYYNVIHNPSFVCPQANKFQPAIYTAAPHNHAGPILASNQFYDPQSSLPFYDFAQQQQDVYYYHNPYHHHPHQQKYDQHRHQPQSLVSSHCRSDRGRDECARDFVVFSEKNEHCNPQKNKEITKNKAQTMGLASSCSRSSVTTFNQIKSVDAVVLATSAKNFAHSLSDCEQDKDVQAIERELAVNGSIVGRYEAIEDEQTATPRQRAKRSRSGSGSEISCQSAQQLAPVTAVNAAATDDDDDDAEEAGDNEGDDSDLSEDNVDDEPLLVQSQQESATCSELTSPSTCCSSRSSSVASSTNSSCSGTSFMDSHENAGSDSQGASFGYHHPHQTQQHQLYDHAYYLSPLSASARYSAGFRYAAPYYTEPYSQQQQQQQCRAIVDCQAQQHAAFALAAGRNLQAPHRIHSLPGQLAVVQHQPQRALGVHYYQPVAHYGPGFISNNAPQQPIYHYPHIYYLGQSTATMKSQLPFFGSTSQAAVSGVFDLPATTMHQAPILHMPTMPTDAIQRHHSHLFHQQHYPIEFAALAAQNNFVLDHHYQQQQQQHKFSTAAFLAPQAQPVIAFGQLRLSYNHLIPFLPIDAEPARTRQAYGMDKVWQDEFERLFARFVSSVVWTLIEVESNPNIRDSSNIIDYRGRYIVRAELPEQPSVETETIVSECDFAADNSDQQVLYNTERGCDEMILVSKRQIEHKKEEDAISTDEGNDDCSCGVDEELRETTSEQIGEIEIEETKMTAPTSEEANFSYGDNQVLSGADGVESDCDSGAQVNMSSMSCSASGSDACSNEPATSSTGESTQGDDGSKSTESTKGKIGQEHEQIQSGSGRRREFPTRFRMFIDSAKVRFCCDHCGHGWTSMKGRVVFWYELFMLVPEETAMDCKPGAGNLIGYCAYKLFGQQCDVCKTEDRFERPMWYPEEVTKVLNNLYNKIGQIYFGFKMPTIDKQRRAGKPKTSHNSSLCQACHDGVCTDRK